MTPTEVPEEERARAAQDAGDEALWWLLKLAAGRSPMTISSSDKLAGIIVGRLDRITKERDEARAALGYIAQPTMALPGGVDPESFVDEALESDVRLALKTCIRMARHLLEGTEKE